MNSIKPILTLLLGLCAAGTSAAENPAGIVLYLTTGNGVYLLLADHTGDSDRGWSGFGGSGEDGETPAQTAARQTEEETRGFFSRSNLLNRISGTDPVIDGTFHLYFLEIEFVPALRIGNNRTHTEDEDYRERGPYAWIPFSEVEKYFDGDAQDSKKLIDRHFLPSNANTDWFWNVWLRNMHKARKMGALPWEQPSSPPLSMVSKAISE